MCLAKSIKKKTQLYDNDGKVRFLATLAYQTVEPSLSDHLARA